MKLFYNLILIMLLGITPIAAEAQNSDSSKSKKYKVELSGFVNLRASYDCGGIVKSPDFITSAISFDSNTNQQFMLDGTTSRFNVKASTYSSVLGDVEFVASLDLRGGYGYADGFQPAYKPRFRLAYVTFKGFTLGRDFTTLLDLDATSRTIDFQGPNAYAFNYSTLIRYQHTSKDNRFTVAAALEMQNPSGDYGGNFETTVQRTPDFISFVDYKLGENLQNHLRLSGIVREISTYNVAANSNSSLVGYGAQLSGNFRPSKCVNLIFSTIAGEGITPYMSDLVGLGLDFAPDPEDATSLKTISAFAYQAAAEVYFSERVSSNLGYSETLVENHKDICTAGDYKRGRFVFANLFYDVTPRFGLAAEYIYGNLENMGGVDNGANRFSVSAQINF